MNPGEEKQCFIHWRSRQEKKLEKEKLKAKKIKIVWSYQFGRFHTLFSVPGTSWWDGSPVQTGIWTFGEDRIQEHNSSAKKERKKKTRPCNNKAKLNINTIVQINHFKLNQTLCLNHLHIHENIHANHHVLNSTLGPMHSVSKAIFHIKKLSLSNT